MDRFRRDLLDRLKGITITLPALRNRREDIIPLARALLAKQKRVPDPRLSPAAERWLVAQAWPGNVRELERALQRGAVLCDNGVIEVEHLCTPGHVAVGAPSGFVIPDARFTGPLDEYLAGCEEEYLRRLMATHGGNITQAAAQAHRDRNNLRAHLRRYGIIDPPNE
jgi:DNA-binding NtrC family response regulator